MTSLEYSPRLVDPLLDRLLTEVPAVLLVGPRAAGKTTSAIRLAQSVVRLDQQGEAVAFRADPDAALRGLPEPVLLDEWQMVPGVLGALKRAVDTDPRPGRFIVTGSVRADLESEGWPATGRVIRVQLYGMSVRELVGRLDTRPLLDRLVEGEVLTLPPEPPDLRGYVELALRGGYPEPALRLSGDTRQRWFESYLEQLLVRDVAMVDGGRDPARMRRYAEVYALNSAGVVEEQTLLEAAGINRRTAIAYEGALTNLFVVEALPAWTTNRLKRLVLSPKRYFVEPAMLAALLRADVNAIMRDGNLLGRLLDTFAVSQLRAELAVCSTRPRLYHLRQEQGRHEVDVVAELMASRVVAFEVKASSAPDAIDARHLAWLRDRLGDRFAAGVVFHTGPRIFSIGDRITAVPICAFWG